MIFFLQIYNLDIKTIVQVNIHLRDFNDSLHKFDIKNII